MGNGLEDFKGEVDISGSYLGFYADQPFSYCKSLMFYPLQSALFSPLITPPFHTPSNSSACFLLLLGHKRRGYVYFVMREGKREGYDA
jgi:hypothetical protein